MRDVQKIEIPPYEQMVYAQPSICPSEWHTDSYGTLAYKRISSSRLEEQTQL